MSAVILRFDNEYDFLSNFYPAKVVLDGETYFSTEHAYQAAKTLDAHARKVIRDACSPGQAKRLGKHVALRPGWEGVKLQVMLDLLRQKFAPGSVLAERLLGTGNAKLVEGNWWGDLYWGVCNGRGANWLGKLLMQVREELQHGP